MVKVKELMTQHKHDIEFAAKTLVDLMQKFGATKLVFSLKNKPKKEITIELEVKR
jgi:hypothetical protein